MQRPAGFPIRFIAALIDFFLLSVPVTTVISLLLFQDLSLLIGEVNASIADPIIIFIQAVLIILFWLYNDGQTPGKRIVGIKVVSDEGKLTFKATILRLLGYFINVLTFFIGFMMIGVRKDKRGLHDILSKTRVVYQDSDE